MFVVWFSWHSLHYRRHRRVIAWNEIIKFNNIFLLAWHRHQPPILWHSSSSSNSISSGGLRDTSHNFSISTGRRRHSVARNKTHGKSSGIGLSISRLCFVCLGFGRLHCRCVYHNIESALQFQCYFFGSILCQLFYLCLAQARISWTNGNLASTRLKILHGLVFILIKWNMIYMEVKRSLSIV